MVLLAHMVTKIMVLVTRQVVYVTQVLCFYLFYSIQRNSSGHMFQSNRFFFIFKF